MVSARAIAVVAIAAHSVLGQAPRIEDIRQPLQRVAFGSCNHQSLEQPLWEVIRENDPQVWLWMGDAMYGDYKKIMTILPPIPKFQEAPPWMLQEKYALQMKNAAYSDLARKVPVIGVWDDHDYGINDGDRTYTYRDQSQQLFLDFLGEPQGSLRRRRKGVYESYTIGNEPHNVKLILLDVRYNKDPYSTIDGDFLGEEQWHWLERELQSSEAAFNIIISGIQVLPQDRFFGGECWNNFPKQRERLLTLILEANLKGVILLSGDVHFAEVNQVECEDHTAILTEITSSGMTHSWETPSTLGFFMTTVFHAANAILAWEFRPTRGSYYGRENFGEIAFDWSAQPLPKAMVRVRGADGQLRLERTITSHYAEHQSSDSGRKCQAIRATLLSIVALRVVVMIGFVGALIGSALAAVLIALWLLYALFDRSFIFMMKLQHDLFNKRGYDKLD